MIETPFEKIKKALLKEIPAKFIDKIPDKWEKIGDVVIIKLPAVIEKYSLIIGRTYAKFLQCKSILNDIGGITGIYREPQNKVIFGSHETTTIHKENGIRYKLDPKKIMFSSGNIDERIRMASISNKKETVIDLFAGIGYFTLPLAVYSKPKKIYACELNPVAYNFLCENIILNNVSNIIEPLKGDNRTIAPKNIADRVIMGYIDETSIFLPIAIRCLKNKKGIIHYHDLFPNKSSTDNILDKINNISKKFNRKTKLISYKNIKSYAPGLNHIVLDIRLG
jgi:tRNA wybutosine-synthesizing protein 2